MFKRSISLIAISAACCGIAAAQAAPLLPPAIAKNYSLAVMGVGQQTQLQFVVSNPNADPKRLVTAAFDRSYLAAK